MMKKLRCVLLCASLCLALAGCSGQPGEELPPFDPAQAAGLLESGAFSETLTEIDQATACALYGIDEATVTGCAVYGSTGATAEELALFTFADEDAAQAGLDQLGYRVEDRKEELADYLPGEMDKLEDAVVRQRGATALLVIAADYGPVDTFLKG